MSEAKTRPCTFPACAVHHICQLPCHRNKTEALANALDAMNAVDFDDVFVRSAEQLRWLDASHQKMINSLKATGLFLHHLWCNAHLNDHEFERLNEQMAGIDEAVKKAEGGAA